jgi:hypothetical protein
MSNDVIGLLVTIFALGGLIYIRAVFKKLGKQQIPLSGFALWILVLLIIGQLIAIIVHAFQS